MYRFFSKLKLREAFSHIITFKGESESWMILLDHHCDVEGSSVHILRHTNFFINVKNREDLRPQASALLSIYNFSQKASNDNLLIRSPSPRQWQNCKASGSMTRRESKGASLCGYFVVQRSRVSRAKQCQQHLNAKKLMIILTFRNSKQQQS